jgi:hypothetical protein
MKSFLRPVLHLLLVLLPLFCVTAQEEPPADAPEDVDVLFLRNGTTRQGTLLGVEGDLFRLRVQVLPGQPSATIGIPRSEVVRIEFASDEERERFLREATVADILTAARYWGAGERFLDLPRSPAARVGLRYAGLLLDSGNPATQERALDLFRQIETQAWSPEDRAAARRGRLRALIATGRAAEAVAEAEELAETAEDPAVLIEAKYILASAAAEDLRLLLEANPRWEEDVFVRPERHRLYHAALDLFLFPYLFFGSEIEPASRGLWAAIEIYQQAGEFIPAMEAARDLLVLYPGTPAAERAQAFLESLPDEIKSLDHEKDAQASLPQ